MTRIAREQVAELIGAHSMDVIFTSCATESNNAAIAAALRANPAKRHIVTSQVEHSSVLKYCMALSSGGFTPPFRSGEFTLPRGGVNPPLLEIIGNLRKLFQGGFQVFGNLGGDNVRVGQVGGVFQAVVFQPEDVKVHLVPFE